MRHVVADHAVLHAFLVILVEVLENDLANRFEGLPAIFGQFREVLFDGCGFNFHGTSRG